MKAIDLQAGDVLGKFGVALSVKVRYGEVANRGATHVQLPRPKGKKPFFGAVERARAAQAEFEEVYRQEPVSVTVSFAGGRSMTFQANQDVEVFNRAA
jgi:hypothetical protein